MIDQTIHKALETANLTDVMELTETLGQRCEELLKTEVREETDPRIKNSLEGTIYDVNGLFNKIGNELGYWA